MCLVGRAGKVSSRTEARACKLIGESQTSGGRGAKRRKGRGRGALADSAGIMQSGGKPVEYGGLYKISPGQARQMRQQGCPSLHSGQAALQNGCAFTDD